MSFLMSSLFSLSNQRATTRKMERRSYLLPFFMVAMWLRSALCMLVTKASLVALISFSFISMLLRRLRRYLQQRSLQTTRPAEDNVEITTNSINYCCYSRRDSLWRLDSLELVHLLLLHSVDREFTLKLRGGHVSSQSFVLIVSKLCDSVIRFF